MQKKTLLLLLSVLLNLILSSCATYPPDDFICIELDPDKGFCTRMISDEDRVWDEQHKMFGKTWWEARPGMLHLPIETWKNLKKYLIQQCKKNNDCAEDLQKWERKMQVIESHMGVH